MSTADLVFALQPNHTFDECVKEIHAKTAANGHPHRTVMQAMIVTVVAYEGVCSHARAVAAAAGGVVVPHTLLEYEALIDRAAHALHLHGGGLAINSPFVENLADAHDELNS